jgi:hypothetical protein
MSKARAKRKRARGGSGAGAGRHASGSRGGAEARRHAPDDGGAEARGHAPDDAGAEARRHAPDGTVGAEAGRHAPGDGGSAAPGGARRRGGQLAEPAGRPSRFDVRDGVARPDAIWSPFPLTEIGMAVGLVIFVAGFASDGRRATWLLSIAVVVLVVVVGELCLREHFGGFRSHTLLLAVLPATIVHVVVVVAISDAWTGPPALAVDLALAGALAWLLRSRFRLAHERARGPGERAP